MTILYIFLIAYFVMMIGIGIYGKRYSKDFQSSIDMGKKGGVILLAGSCIGSNIGNGFVVGGAGKGSVAGLAGSAFGLGCALGALALGVFLSDFIYKHGYTSLADYTKKRYKSDLPGIIYVLSTGFSLVGVFGVQLMAGKILFELLGLDVKLFTILTAVIIFIYAELAGIWGTYATSVIQTIIIIISLIILTVVILVNGGYGILEEGIVLGTAPTGALDFKGLGLMGFMGLCVPVALTTFTSQSDFIRINTAKSAKVSKQAHIIAFFAMIPLAIMPAFIGAYGATKYGVVGDKVFFSVVFNELPEAAAALIVVAVIAAVMSTIAVCYSAVDSIVVNDLLKNILNKTLSEKKMRRISFLLNVVMTISAVGMALNATVILDFLNEFYSLIAAACFIPFVGGILIKKASPVAATAASLVGVACVLLGWCGVNVPSVGGMFPCLMGAVVFIAFTMLNKDA